jgi:hypothetical protein
VDQGLVKENDRLRAKVAVLRREIRRVNARYNWFRSVLRDLDTIKRVYFEHAYMAKEITRLQARVAELEGQHHARTETWWCGHPGAVTMIERVEAVIPEDTHGILVGEPCPVCGARQERAE